MLSAMFTNLLAVADKQRRGKPVVVHLPNCMQRAAVRITVPVQTEQLKRRGRGYFQSQFRR
ncbi:MAG TPA: hypothetical protein V6C97_28150 [Oculatellaceae cyanobacterium]